MSENPNIIFLLGASVFITNSATRATDTARNLEPEPDEVRAAASDSDRSVTPREAYQFLTDGILYLDFPSFGREMWGLEEAVEAAGQPKTVAVPLQLFAYTDFDKVESQLGRYGRITEHELPGYHTSNQFDVTGKYYWYGRLAFGVMDVGSIMKMLGPLDHIGRRRDPNPEGRIVRKANPCFVRLP